eukprot:708028-Pyramimonas_sp.AAC.1
MSVSWLIVHCASARARPRAVSSVVRRRRMANSQCLHREFSGPLAVLRLSIRARIGLVTRKLMCFAPDGGPRERRPL